MVQILISTYNGEKFLREQLDSILLQKNVKYKILIRDDGSKDKTKEIIKEYSEKYHNIDYIFGENKGVIKSFLELLEKADENCEFFSFCDQDDYWEENKLSEGIKKIKDIKNVLYCSNLKIVDNKLNFIRIRYKKKLVPSYENSIVENIVTGCTIIMDKHLRKKILKEIKKIDLNKILMHDWLFYILASVYGRVIYDFNSYIKYRQHDGNVIGMKKNFFLFLMERIKNVRKYKGKRKKQLSEIKKIITDDIKLKEIDKILHKEWSVNIKRQNKIDEILTKIMIKIGWY